LGLTEFSLRKPTAIIMMVVLIIGLGVFGYVSLDADLFPAVNTPLIMISAEYPGASVSEIEKDVLIPVEDEVAGISGIDTIRSGAVIGYGYTIIMFNMNVDINNAFMDVQQAMARIGDRLPSEVSRPEIKKYDKNGEPVMMLSVSGSLPYYQVAGQAKFIEESLQRLPGVGEVSRQGQIQQEVKIEVDKTRLDYYGVSLNSIINQIKVENMDVPVGELKQPGINQPLQVRGEFKSTNDLAALKIPSVTGGPITLGDMAKVSWQDVDPDQKFRFTGQNSIGIVIHKQSDANIVAVIDNVRDELKKLESQLPEGLELTIASDQSSFIRASLREVKKNLLEAVIFTALIMILFLRNWRTALIVLISIPTSLVATFFMIYMFGFSLNIITILALSVCIGILVDDSIVVLENIQRHRSLGEDGPTAAIRGRQEIAMAAIAITMCDVVVFGPVAFLSDIVGQFFRQFGLTVVAAALFSLLISFTITPLLSARMLQGEVNGHKTGSESVHASPNRLRKVFADIQDTYKYFLIWALDHRGQMISLVLGGLILSSALIPLGFIKSEFLPRTDQSRLTINLTLAPGSNLNQTDDKVQEVESYLQAQSEVKDYLAQIGSSNSNNQAVASLSVNLVDKNNRELSQAQLAEQFRTWGQQMSGVEFEVTEDSLVGRTSVDGTKPIAINISGGDYQVLQSVGQEVEAIVKSVPGTADVNNSDRGTQSEYDITINRAVAAQAGISTADIAATLRAGINGSTVGVFRKNGEDYDIRVQIAGEQVRTINDIGSIMIANAAGQKYRLEDIADFERSDSGGELHRRDRQKLITIAADIEGRTLGEVDGDISARIKKLDLPAGVIIKAGGDQENMQTGFSSLLKALLVSILLIYMILVVLYDSYLTPLIRMMSIPCGLIGAFAALAITHNTFNIVTLIGFIMLDGLASKNGTLLIDYTNTLLKRGLSLREALLEAGTTRLRPILMTSVTMIAGFLPAALAVGAGSEIKSGMAIALIGGMVTSTLLSPVLLPVIYTLMNDLTTRRANRRKDLEVQI